jgi:molecular chaperone DnaK
VRTIGIDLGTTNTVLAKNAKVLGGSRGTTTHSVVSFTPTGETLVGEAARSRRAIDPKNTIASAKRVIGRGFDARETSLFLEASPLSIVRRDDGGIAFSTRQGSVRPEDVARLVIAEAVERAGENPRKLAAVVGVPATFDGLACAATLEAARDVGFPEVHLVAEPIATAIAYLARSNLRHALVYDLGGGTFDVAIVDCTRQPFTVVASGGDVYLGGDDIDRSLARWTADKVLRASGWDLASDLGTFDRLVMECERAKLRLSTDETTTLDICAVDEAAPTGVASIALDRTQMVSLAEPFVTRTLTIVDEVLRGARLTPKDVDAIFLAGGSTALPSLRERVRDHFGGRRPRFDLDPMHVVATGASLAAARPDLAGLLSATT